MLPLIQQYPSPNISTLYFSLAGCIYQFVPGFVGNPNPLSGTLMYATLVNCCTGPASTTRDYSITNVGNSYWNFANFNDPSNPTITLTRGQTYRFHVCAEGYRFAIGDFRESFLAGDGAVALNDINVITPNNTNGEDTGTITFTPNSSYGNNVLYYFAYSINGQQVQNYPNGSGMWGLINLQG